MFSKFADVLQNAADVLAPPATKFAVFEYHWKMILHYYENYDNNSKDNIDDTRIPHHLHQMVQALVDEESEQPEGSVGECLKALGQRTICLLDALPVLAVADRPPGARALALNTATQLLRRTKQPFLENPTVYNPLQSMLIQCNDSPASPTEKEEVELLLTLCGFVRKDPSLAVIFTTPLIYDKTIITKVPDDVLKLFPIKKKVQTPTQNPLFDVEPPMNPTRFVTVYRMNGKEEVYPVGSGSSFSFSIPDDRSDNPSPRFMCEENEKFLLIDLLVSYLKSADSQVVLRACEGIMIMSSLPEDEIASLVTQCSPTCETIVNQLATKYRAVPGDMDPNDVEHLNITWASIAQDFDEASQSKFHGYRELTSFFSWLNYCDTLMSESHTIISAHLSRMFRYQFLENAAEYGIKDLRHAIVVTAILSKCLKVIESSELVNEFSVWLVGDGEVLEWPTLDSLINNSLVNNTGLTLETLKFFETIVDRGTEHSIKRLVLSRICTRRYHVPVPPTEEEKERERLNDLSLDEEQKLNKGVMVQIRFEEDVQRQFNNVLVNEGLEPPEEDAAGEDTQRIINSFLLLLPRALLSDPVGSDYENYIHDAHRHYQLWLDITSTFNWPREQAWENTASSTHSYDSRPEADIHLDEAFEPKPNKCCNDNVKSDKCNNCQFTQRLVLKSGDLTSNVVEEEFNEGPFFRMLFKLISRMPTQPYQVNLHLTALISKLALMPHPNLHEYLLNPLLPTAKKTPTLFKALQEVSKRLAVEIPKLRNYKQIIENTRLQLMSEDPSYDESGEHNTLVESLIVVEEFCKELAAIAFVKYQHSMHMHR